MAFRNAYKSSLKLRLGGERTGVSKNAKPKVVGMRGCSSSRCCRTLMKMQIYFYP